MSLKIKFLFLSFLFLVACDGKENLENENNNLDTSSYEDIADSSNFDSNKEENIDLESEPNQEIVEINNEKNNVLESDEETKTIGKANDKEDLSEDDKAFDMEYKVDGEDPKTYDEVMDSKLPSTDIVRNKADNVFQIEGLKFKLPVKVSSLIENGFDIYLESYVKDGNLVKNPNSLPESLSSSDHATIRVEKNGMKFYASVINNYDDNVIIDEMDIIEFWVISSNKNLLFDVNGINIGDSYSDLKNYYKDKLYDINKDKGHREAVITSKDIKSIRLIFDNNDRVSEVYIYDYNYLN